LAAWRLGNRGAHKIEIDSRESCNVVTWRRTSANTCFSPPSPSPRASAASARADSGVMAQLRQVGYLWRSAHLHAHTAPELSRTFTRELLLHAERESIELPQRLLQRVCCKCCSVLVPGLNCTTMQRRCPRRPVARRRELRVHCLGCGHTAAFVMAAKPSGRASSSATAAAPAPAPAQRSAAAQRAAGSAAPPTQHAASLAKGGKTKTKSRAPPAPPAPAPSSDAGTGLFGFDFVPF
jgi:RNase P subunit RPR2